MSTQTQGFIIFLQSILMVAEAATEFSTIPQNMRKQTKDGVLYVSGVYMGINYLVAAKSNRVYQVA